MTHAQLTEASRPEVEVEVEVETGSGKAHVSGHATYTHQDESGASLRAAGWTVVAERASRKGWDTPTRRRLPQGTDNVPRYLWVAT